MPLLTGALIVGGAMKIMGSLKASRSARRQARQARRLAEFEATEIERRTALDISVTERTAGVFRGQQTAAFASGGIDVGGDSSLIVMEQTARAFAERITDIRGEGAFRAQVTRMGGSMSAAVANDRAKAHNIEAMGSFISLGADIYGGK